MKYYILRASGNGFGDIDCGISEPFKTKEEAFKVIQNDISSIFRGGDESLIPSIEELVKMNDECGNITIKTSDDNPDYDYIWRIVTL